MPKATSLIELILKKWGDDTAGAAKELEEVVGYPESVARRIATGELPMDPESVARRADERYTPVRYRGINGEYDPDKAGYYQMFTTSRQDAAEYGDNVIEARLNLGDNAVVDGGGRNFNSILTEDGLLVRTDDLAHEAREAGRDSLTIRNIHDKADNEIPRRPSTSNTGPSDEEIMRELGLDYSPSPNASPAPDARNYDPVDVDVVFDPSRIRSPNAAFDPEYTGSNIMGNADPRLLAGIAALTGTGMLAPLVVDGKFQHSATKKPKVTKKEKKKEEGMLGELSDALASLSWLSDKRSKLIASILLSDQFEKGMEHSQLPARGIWGTGRLAAGAALGEKPSDTRRAANRIYTQPTDKTLQEAGQYVLKKTGSPAAAAATSTLGMLTDPTFWL